MGSSESTMVQKDKISWPSDPQNPSHELSIDAALRIEQLPLVDKFRDTLFLFKHKVQCGTLRDFRHYFISDGTWTIEFGDENWDGNSVPEFNVQIHSKGIPEDSIEEQKFTKDAAVIERMREVCGSRGYSLCFRNSEHLSRYIFRGGWNCSQMLPGSHMHEAFARHMEPHQKKLLNSKPKNLIRELKQLPLYEDVEGFVKYERSPQAIDPEDDDAFNIVLLGPTGCGKSNLINHYFNTTVSQTAGCAESVTRDILFFLGRALLARAPSQMMPDWHLETRKVNIIDTIGLCDSVIPTEIVQQLIKQKLKGNLAHIDRVVIVCAGRIELQQQEAVKQMMDWLQFKKYPENFTFVYNKSDMLTEEEREEALFQMCAMLEAGNHVLTCDRALFPSAVLTAASGGRDSDRESAARESSISHTKKEMKLRSAIGLKPRSTYEDIKADLEQLLDSTMIPIKGKSGYQRIPLNVDACSIL